MVAVLSKLKIRMCDLMVRLNVKIELVQKSQPRDDSVSLLHCLICLFKFVVICLFLKSPQSELCLLN